MRDLPRTKTPVKSEWYQKHVPGCTADRKTWKTDKLSSGSSFDITEGDRKAYKTLYLYKKYYRTIELETKKSANTTYDRYTG